MTNFVANVQWDINQVDLSLYSNNAVDFGTNLGDGFSLNGTNYPDRLFVEGQNGSINRFIYAYGDFGVNALGVPSSGTFSALQEFDVNTSSTRWFADGFVVSASAAANAVDGGDLVPIVISQLGGNDTITLSPFDDVMGGFDGNDTIKGGGGNDTLDGGTGSDTAIFDGSFASATISFEGTVVVISTPTDGTDRLSNFEFVNFNGDVRSTASLNGPPVPVAETDAATEDGSVITGQLSATDPEGNPLTFAVVAPGISGLTIDPDGSYSFDPSRPAYQSVGQGQTFLARASYTVSDGFNTVTSTLTVVVSGVNDSPEVAPTAQFETAANTPQAFSVSGSDIDGDMLSYTASDPANGMVTGGENGQFTYTPTNGFAGMDSFMVTVSDGKGGTAIQTLTVTVTAQNGTPVASPATATAVEDGAIVTGQLVATDPEDDPLTFSPILTGQFAPGVAGLVINPDGSYSFDPSNAEYQGLAQDEEVELLAGYFVSDGGLSSSSTLTITITGVNDAPVFDPGAMEIATTVGNSKDFSATATDIDGDMLTYSASDPANGMVTGGENGQFTYTPDPGFTGTDSVDVMVMDSAGGEAARTIIVEVVDPSDMPAAFKVLTTTGFSGQIGGYGAVFAAPGSQVIEVLDLPGLIEFASGFNAGGKGVILPGQSSGWTVQRDGSDVILSDGDTFAVLPVGPLGLPIAFDDGTYSLGIAGSDIALGGQVVTNAVTPFAPVTDGEELPGSLDPDARAKLIMFPDGEVIAGGNYDFFGTNASEKATVLNGEIDFDASWNNGNDEPGFDDPAGGSTARRESSDVIIETGDTIVSLPIGLGMVPIDFGGDIRIMSYTLATDTLMIGPDVITTEDTPLSFA